MRYPGETASTPPRGGGPGAFALARIYGYIERMLKSSGGPSIGLEPASTKQKIVQAAFDTLSSEGFAAATARSIARRGEFNQALIFYHFGTLNDLLLAALEVSGAARLTRYREEMSDANTIEQRIQTATRLYREDLDSGHITVLAEIIAGSLSEPSLGPKVIDLMKPWIDFAAEIIEGSIAGSVFEALIDPHTAAFAVVAMYLGVDLLTLLDKDDSRAEALFQSAGGLATLLTS